MRNIIVLVCIALAISSCSNDKVKISGKISNAANGVLYLDEVDVYSTLPADSVKLKKNGRFSFSFEAKLPCIYQLRLSPDKVIVLFPKPGEHIKINASAQDLLASLKTEGSHDTQQINMLMAMLHKAKARMDSVTLLYEKSTVDSARNLYNREYQKILESHRKASIAYLLTNYNSLSSVYVLYQQYEPNYYVFYKTTDLQYFKIISDSLVKYHPRSKHVEALKAYTDRLIGDYNTQLILQSSKISNKLPEIRLPDYAGDTISLNSLKGKYVLLSFWSAGNQVCITQNLQLKQVYNNFRSKGFEVYQVSFDNSLEAWKRAVRYDELPWISVIDTNYPNSSIAGNYNVNQLPSNYLIDKDNLSILAKNLTPAQLKDKLDDLYN